MMDIDVLYDSNEQMEATKRVLAVIRIRNINNSIDELMADIIKYAQNIDQILESNNLTKRYLDRISSIDMESISEVYLDADLKDLDFRIAELINDYLKRINTRLNLIKDNGEIVGKIESTYSLTEYNFENDVKIANLREKDFANI